MPADINVTDEQISKAESILLPEGMSFDAERRDFIRRFQTLDLQAVPGSGKTTTLLAKLIALEDFFPLPDRRGVLVLSHTNAAIEEIIERISPYCPNLLSYPNYIGTIQSFVDTYLAIPYYTNLFKKKPYRIDNEIYNEELEKMFSYNIKGFKKQEQKNARYYLMGKNLLTSYRFKVSNGVVVMTDKMNGKVLSIEKPRRGKNWVDFTINDKRKIKKWIKRFKFNIMENNGVLHFDDAYFLADLYMHKFPQILKILQQSFKYVFVDEMQDMDVHQYNILEKIFFDAGNSPCSFQRIGDKNQSIFNANVKLDEIWSGRDLILNINGSHRLTPQVANLVDCFALERNVGFQVTGLRQGAIKPHIIVFDDKNINNVLSKYSEIINSFIMIDEIDLTENSNFKAIAWVKENAKLDKLGLSDYFPEFNQEQHHSKIDYPCFESYLVNTNFSNGTLESGRKNILNALLRVLRIESIVDSENKYYSKRKLLKTLRENFPTEYENLKLYLYQWSMKLIKGKKEKVFDELLNYISSFLLIFEKEINHSNEFINKRLEINKPEKDEDIEVDLNENNLVNYHGFDIEVTTIHSAKGQTHTATLYLETDFYSSCESSRLSNQFKFINLNGNEGKRIKQSSKMCYVGLSRPTHLLCVAIHRSRFDLHFQDVDKTKFEVIKLNKK